jgi:hypothetical protein
MTRLIPIRSSHTLVVLALAACAGGGSTGRVVPATAVATGSAGGYTVRLLATGDLEVGLNALAVEVRTDTGAPVADATVELRPLMDMGAMQHRCPVVGPGAAGADGRYAVSAVFQMASTTMGTWSAEVAVTRNGTTEVVPLSPLEVVAGKNLARTFVAGESKYVMALELPSSIEVGLNPVVVTLHETRDGGMTFTPVDDATLALDPQMPSMGHGAPGSVNPTRVDGGWYEGKLALTMSGEWETTVTATRAEAAIGAPSFTVRF